MVPRVRNDLVVKSSITLELGDVLERVVLKVGKNELFKLEIVLL
jgi:hypothetical protein